MIYTDNRDFYPTPKALFQRLIRNNLRYVTGRILEPSAGKGDMIKHILGINNYRRSDALKIDAIENDPRLVNTLTGEGFNVVWDDFLTYETFKEYDYIIMNPPFYYSVDHVYKAQDIAELLLSHCGIYTLI